MILEKKQLLSNFFSLSVLQIFTYILPLITLPYLVRVLGSEKFGLIMFAQAFIIFFNIFVDFGFSLSATKDISVYRNDKIKITEIFSSVMIIKAILIIIAMLLLSFIVFLFDKFSKDWDLYYLTFLWVIGQALFPIWYFQGMEKMKYITIVNIISRVIFTLLIFIVIKEESDYIYVPLLNGMGFIIGGIISLWIIYKNFNQPFKIQNFNTLKYYFYESSQFFLSRISLTLYTSSNAFVLGLFTNNIMVGYYSIAEKLYQAMQQAYQPIVQALYPYVAKNKNIPLFKKIFTISVFLNILGVIFLFFVGQYIFDLLFTAKIGSESLEVFHILLIASVIVVPSILLGYPFLGALGYAKYANMSVLYGSLFHIIGLGILIAVHQVSIYNVASLVIATEMLVLFIRLYWVKRKKLWKKQ
jgi:PST family polysaccharide transporter